MKISKGLLWVSVMAGFSWQAVADIAALNKAANKLCEKSKVCIKQQLAIEGLPPGMEAMVANMMDEMCSNFSSIATVGEHHELVEPATACLNSLADKSCDDLLNSDGETPACQRYNAIAEKY